MVTRRTPLTPNYFEVPALAEERPDLPTCVAQFRRWVILGALGRNDGNVIETARDLGIGYSTLKTYLKAYRAELPNGCVPATTLWRGNG